MRLLRLVTMALVAVTVLRNPPLAWAQQTRAGMSLLHDADSGSSTLTFTAYLQEEEPEPDQALMARASARAAGGNAMMFPIYATAREAVLRLDELGQQLSWDASSRVQVGTLGWVAASKLKVEPTRNYVFVNVGPYALTLGEIAIKKGEYVKVFNGKCEKGAQSLVNPRDASSAAASKKGQRPDRNPAPGPGEMQPRPAGDSKKTKRPVDRPANLGDAGKGHEKPMLSDVAILSARLKPPRLWFSVNYQAGSAKVVVGFKAQNAFKGTKVYVGIGPPELVANVVNALEKDVSSGSRLLATYADQGVSVSACLPAGLQQERPGWLRGNLAFADVALQSPNDVPVSFFLVDESGAMSDPFQVWVDFTKGAITKGLVRGGKARD